MTRVWEKTAIQAINGILKAVVAAENGAGTLPARQSVKLRPSDWSTLCSVARSAVTQASDEITSLRAERDALRGENERLKAALKPFGRLGAWCYPGWVDQDTSWVGVLGDFGSDPEPPTVGDLRRALELSA